MIELFLGILFGKRSGDLFASDVIFLFPVRQFANHGVGLWDTFV